MFLRILKNDLKRKKTMNVILLLFVILCSAFAAASVNNIIAVSGGIEHYFEKAGLADYFIISKQPRGGATDKIIAECSYVDDFKQEDCIFATSEALKTPKGKLMEFSNVLLVNDISRMQINIFDENNDPITSVEEGKVWITGGVPRRENVKVGDRFTFSLGDTETEFEVAGFGKDALLGSDMMANPRLLMNPKDFEKLLSDQKISGYDLGQTIYIKSDDTNKLESALSDIDSALFSGSRSLIKTTYMMNMLVAVIVLVISVGLILVAFIAMRFTIRFTISEEFHEIGVMKAIGIKNASVRSLYIVKYLGIAVVGAFIGYFASLPFGSMMLESVSENMVLGSDHSVLIGILSCLAVVGLMLLFSYTSTRKVNKLSPIDAVRNGQTGERFRKRSILRLGKSRLGSTGFMAVNDVLSEPRHYSLLTAVFTVCISMVMILAVTADTLDSDSMLYLLSVTKSDAYYFDSTKVMEVMSGAKTIKESEEEIEDLLAQQGMPARVFLEEMYSLPVASKEGHFTVRFMKCDDTDAADYVYTEGYPPSKEDEIAITIQVAEKLNVQTGDHITITIAEEPREFMVTALFQSFNDLGECGRFHQDMELPDTMMTNAFAYQVDFDDDPDEAEIHRRIEKLKKVTDNKNIYDVKGFVNDCMGVSDTISAVRDLTLLVAMAIVILLSVLMERSVISREKPQIALMKAMGFSSGSVICHHILRFVITGIAAAVISSLLVIPLTNLIISPIFGMMGAVADIGYTFDAPMLFGFYPAVILAVVVLSVTFTALYTKTIKASDTASIE